MSGEKKYGAACPIDNCHFVFQLVHYFSFNVEKCVNLSCCIAETCGVGVSGHFILKLFISGYWQGDVVHTSEK